MGDFTKSDWLPWELKIIEHYGTKEAFSQIFDPPVANTTIRYWKQNGIPVKRVFEIERLTAGRIDRHDMRPDIWPTRRAPVEQEQPDLSQTGE